MIADSSLQDYMLYVVGCMLLVLAGLLLKCSHDYV
jgi:hypothetical protein